MPVGGLSRGGTRSDSETQTRQTRDARALVARPERGAVKSPEHVSNSLTVDDEPSQTRKDQILRAQHDALRVMRERERELAGAQRRRDERLDLTDDMPLLVWTADPAGRIQYGNRRWESLSGGEHDFASVVAPEDLPRFTARWNEALASGQEWEAEVRFGNRTAGWRVHLVRVVPRRDEAGVISSWVGTSTDIDARVRAERSFRMLADASRRLGATLEDPTEIEAVVRRALPILGDLALLDVESGSVHKRVAVSAGVAATTLLDDPRFDLAPVTVMRSGRPEVHRDVAEEVAASRPGRAGTHAQFLSELGVGSYLCLPLTSRNRSVGTLTLVRVGSSEPYEMGEVSLAEDLARRIAVAVDNAHLHETTERRRGELEQANKSKDVFLATLSHELRTPLNAIVGWTDLLRNGQLTADEIDRAIETIDRNALALNHLVADLLDVSRIVTGSLKLDSKLVSLASVVEAAIETARPQCSSKRLALEVTLDRSGCVMGDAGRLRQIFGNLLSNAIKFTPAGGSITVRVTRVGDQGRVVVTDSGEGIAADFLPFVFDRFRQAEDATARGLGLGLAIVKHLVTEQGGSVEAKSDGSGKGATFTIFLPIASEESFFEDRESSGRLSSAMSVNPHLEGVHALIVEDDPDGNELITTILQRYGARVTSVGTAAAALDALDEHQPDILVSDIGLPDTDGIELIKLVRKRAFAASMPAIALTAYASRQDAAKAVGAGFDAHVAKPVQPGTLGSTVARLIKRARSA